MHLTLVNADEKYDCTQRCEGGHHNKNKDKQTAQIFLLRSLAYFALRHRPNCHPIKN